MAKTATYRCQCCKAEFKARTADRKRGWARFCSKSCKALRQTQRTGRGHPDDQRRDPYAAYDSRGREIGFYAPPFDNTEHQNSEPDDGPRF